MLLNYLSRANVRQFGVRVQGEAVVQGEHTLYLILEAGEEGRVRQFMRPFEMAGSVEIYGASTCARVVASGGCGAAMPASGASAIDPEEACQQAIEAGLVVHRAYPLNAETSIPALIGGTVMPSARFYIRNHFQIPALDPASFRLRVGGAVERPLSLSLRDLLNMPSRTDVVTLECLLAGGASRRGAQAPQLAVVGRHHPHRDAGHRSHPARATDLAGRTQPETAEWNRLGYGNNAIQQVAVEVLA